MTTKTVWERLSQIDMSPYAKEKGKFHYVPWARAWAALVEAYPDALYDVFEPQWFPDGTVEVSTAVEVEGVTREMWLPVTNFSNRPIENPNAFEINSAKMRCLVKNFSMFGLGSSYFLGEVAEPPGESEDEKQLEKLLLHNKAAAKYWAEGCEMKQALEVEDYVYAYGVWHERIPERAQNALRVAHTKGGIFTTAEQAAMKSNDWTAARKTYHKEEI
jgi:hypothetical protein